MVLLRWLVWSPYFSAGLRVEPSQLAGKVPGLVGCPDPLEFLLGSQHVSHPRAGAILPGDQERRGQECCRHVEPLGGAGM